MTNETGSLWEDELFEDTNANDYEPVLEDDSEDLSEGLFEQEEDLTTERQQENSEDEENLDELNSLGEFLKNARGINPDSIKIQDENGQEIEVTWDDLTKEEQLQILNDVPTNDDNDLDDSEIDLLNRIRLAQMTPEEYIQSEILKGIALYAAENQEAPAVQYSVDQLSDDELFIADLASRLPEDTTDEELAEALETAKQNENLYKKQIDGLRAEYRQYEDSLKEQEEALANQKSQEEFEQFSGLIINAIENMNSNQNSLNVQLEQDDMEELAEFILGQDGAGINHFSKALNNPNVLVNMAWWALHGNETMDSIASYYENLIKAVAQKQYEKGLADGLGRQNTDTLREPEVVIDKKPRTVINRNVTSINDLY